MIINIEQCQAICDDEEGCAVFRYEKQTGKCSRFDEDYRQDCIYGGGSAVNDFIMYLDVINHTLRNLFLAQNVI